MEFKMRKMQERKMISREEQEFFERYYEIV